MSNATRFLRELLSGGPMSTIAVREAAEEFGISIRELREASEQLNVVKVPRKGGAKMWELPEEIKEIPTEWTSCPSCGKWAWTPQPQRLRGDNSTVHPQCERCETQGQESLAAYRQRRRAEINQETARLQAADQMRMEQLNSEPLNFRSVAVEDLADKEWPRLRPGELIPSPSGRRIVDL